MDQFLLNLMNKIRLGSKKKSRYLRIEPIYSVLRIAYKIAETVKWDNIIVETKECDIYFEDYYNYYLSSK